MQYGGKTLLRMYRRAAAVPNTFAVDSKIIIEPDKETEIDDMQVTENV